MNVITKRFLILGLCIVGFTTFAFGLTQVVRYKPWGVPDNRREDYDRNLAEIQRRAELRDRYAGQQPRAKIAVTRTEIDFGWVTGGEALSHVAVVTNQGDADLTLKVRETSSDQLKLACDRETIEPGGEAECSIDFVVPVEPNSEGFSESVTLVTNDPFQQVVNLNIRGRQRRELVVPPEINFGIQDLGEPAWVEFLVYSQLGRRLEIVDISGDAHDIQWVATPGDVDHESIGEQSATAASLVRLEIESEDYGRYAGEIGVKVKLDGVERQSKISLVGRVRSPIGFYGPEVDSRKGISFGTVESGERHDLFVVVRSRADKSRPIEVLDVEPAELQTELTPLGTEGSYRLRVSIPADCPYRRFNLAQQHGYVQVGDPKQTDYSGWLPVFGCVGNFQQN